jgi:hypothetical protein
MNRRTRSTGLKWQYPQPSVIASVTILLALSIGCSTPDRGKALLPPGDFDMVFPLVHTIQLEERQGVLTVWPMVTSDPEGGFLLADLQEGQARRYSAQGRLLGLYGRKGNGPGEFRNASAVTRLPDGDVLVSETVQRAAVFSGTTDSLLSAFNWPFRRVDQIEPLTDSTLLIAALEGDDPDSPRLHVWDYIHRRLVYSYFAPMDNTPHRDVALMAGWTRFDIKGDTVAAIFSVSDSVYLMDVLGKSLEIVPLPEGLIRRPTPRPRAVVQRDRRARAEWMTSYDLVSSIYWGPDGSFLVSYQTYDNTVPAFSAALVSRDGVLSVHIPRAPRLLTALDTAIVFVSPDSPLYNRWYITSWPESS